MTQAVYSFSIGGDWQKAFDTDNSGDTAFTTYTVKSASSFSTETAGVTDPSINNAKKSNVIQAVFIAKNTVSAANDDFNIRITGWNLYGDVYVPHQIAIVTATVGSSTGLAGSAYLPETYLLCDTIVQVSGDDQVKIISPADNSVASISFDPLGSKLVQYELDMGTGAPTLCNVLWRIVS